MKVSLTQTAYQKVRRMILDWKLPPGSVLSEYRLAEQLKISRTPIREAVLLLSQEGLVKNIPGESAVVAELSMRDVIESYQMRIALESYAASLAAANPRSRELLTPVMDEMKRAHRIIDRGHLAAYHALSERADSLIAIAADNQMLSESLYALWGQVSRIRRIADIRGARLHESVDEHLATLAAILAGKEHEAEAASRTHLSSSLNHVLRQLAHRSEGGDGAERRGGATRVARVLAKEPRQRRPGPKASATTAPRTEARRRRRTSHT